MAANFPGPMPLTSIKSSMVWNLPWAARWDMMALADEGPIPGNFCSALALAVLMSSGTAGGVFLEPPRSSAGACVLCGQCSSAKDVGGGSKQGKIVSPPASKRAWITSLRSDSQSFTGPSITPECSQARKAAPLPSTSIRTTTAVFSALVRTGRENLGSFTLHKVKRGLRCGGDGGHALTP